MSFENQGNSNLFFFFFGFCCNASKVKDAVHVKGMKYGFEIFRGIFDYVLVKDDD